MAFVKISELPLVIGNLLPLTAGDIMPIVHGPTTYKVELSTLADYFNQALSLSAAGKDYYVQYSLNGKLCADAGFQYLQPLSGLQVGYDNILNGLNSGILGGAFNTNNNTNTFILGSNINANVDNYTLVDNLSARGLVHDTAGSSEQWNSAYTYVNVQSTRLSMPELDTRYVNASGDTMTGDLSVGADIYVNNLTVWNDLSVLGDTTYIDTTVTTSSALSVINFGTGAALTVEQHGVAPIAYFRDPDGGFVAIDDGGKLGVNTYTPNKELTVVGDISATGSIYGNLSGALPFINNVLYVSENGDDNNSGRNIFSPLRTLKKACSIVSYNQEMVFPVTPTIGFPGRQWTIFMVTGDYTEENPIYVPPYTSIIGDNLRRVQIRPANRTYDILWLNTACYIWGMTFRDHLEPSAATAFPNLNQAHPQYDIAFNTPGKEISTAYNNYYRTEKPYVITSPYTQGSSSITTSEIAPQQTLITQTISSLSPVLYPDNIINNTASAAVIGEFNAFIQTILRGTSGTPATEPTNLGNVPSDATPAVAALRANRSTFQNYITGYIQTTYPWLLSSSNYQYKACYRDAGFVVDSICADLQSGTNARIVETANVYYVGVTTSSSLPYGSILPSPLPNALVYTDVWSHAQDYICTNYLNYLPNASAYVRNEFDNLTATLDGGYESVAINTLCAVTPDMYKAAVLLSANRSFFQHELTAYVDNNFEGFAYGQGLASSVYGAKQKCFRDMGWVIDAMVYDLSAGTNARAITYANSYYLGASSRIANQEITTAATIEYGKYLASFIIGNSAVQTTPAGCGIRVDGSLARGFLRSFVTDSYTQTNEGGLGIHITNNGYAQLVSTFTICCRQGIRADNGGNCSVNTSNCSFGLTGLAAVGFSPTPVLTGQTSTNTAFNTDVIEISGVYPRYDPPDFKTYPVPITVPYVGLIYQITNDPTNTAQLSTNYILTSAFRVDNDGTYTYRIINNRRTNDEIPKGGNVYFYIRSQIATGSHTFEYIGSGNVLQDSVPALGGIAKTDDEARAADGGAVFFTSTNHLGDFKVGNGFTIVQETGTIEGRTFQRAILALVTPLTLALE